MSGGIGVVRRMERWRPEPSGQEPSSDAGPANHRWGRTECR